MNCARVLVGLILLTALPISVRAASVLEGTWSGVINGPGNHIVIRIAGFPGRLTATTDSPDQRLVALPTEAAVDAMGNVTIKVDEQTPLTFTGVLSGNTIIGNWNVGGATGTMTLTRPQPTQSSDDVDAVPRLVGTWVGVRPPFNLHYILHVQRGSGPYHVTADSPDQGATGLGGAAKADALSNVFLSIDFKPAFYFSGVLDGDVIYGTWSQDGGMGEMTFARQH